MYPPKQSLYTQYGLLPEFFYLLRLLKNQY